MSLNRKEFEDIYKALCQYQSPTGLVNPSNRIIGFDFGLSHDNVPVPITRIIFDNAQDASSFADFISRSFNLDSINHPGRPKTPQPHPTNSAQSVIYLQQAELGDLCLKLYTPQLMLITPQLKSDWLNLSINLRNSITPPPQAKTPNYDVLKDVKRFNRLMQDLKTKREYSKKEVETLALIPEGRAIVKTFGNAFEGDYIIHPNFRFILEQLRNHLYRPSRFKHRRTDLKEGMKVPKFDLARNQYYDHVLGSGRKSQHPKPQRLDPSKPHTHTLKTATSALPTYPEFMTTFVSEYGVLWAAMVDYTTEDEFMKNPKLHSWDPTMVGVKDKKGVFPINAVTDQTLWLNAKTNFMNVMTTRYRELRSDINKKASALRDIYLINPTRTNIATFDHNEILAYLPLGIENIRSVFTRNDSYRSRLNAVLFMLAIVEYHNNYQQQRLNENAKYQKIDLSEIPVLIIPVYAHNTVGNPHDFGFDFREKYSPYIYSHELRLLDIIRALMMDCSMFSKNKYAPIKRIIKQSAPHFISTDPIIEMLDEACVASGIEIDVKSLAKIGFAVTPGMDLSQAMAVEKNRLPMMIHFIKTSNGIDDLIKKLNLDDPQNQTTISNFFSAIDGFINYISTYSNRLEQTAITQDNARVLADYLARREAYSQLYRLYCCTALNRPLSTDEAIKLATAICRDEIEITGQAEINYVLGMRILDLCDIPKDEDMQSSASSSTTATTSTASASWSVAALVLLYRLLPKLGLTNSGHSDTAEDMQSSASSSTTATTSTASASWSDAALVLLYRLLPRLRLTNSGHNDTAHAYPKNRLQRATKKILASGMQLNDPMANSYLLCSFILHEDFNLANLIATKIPLGTIEPKFISQLLEVVFLAADDKIKPYERYNIAITLLHLAIGRKHYQAENADSSTQPGMSPIDKIADMMNLFKDTDDAVSTDLRLSFILTFAKLNRPVLLNKDSLDFLLGQLIVMRKYNRSKIEPAPSSVIRMTYDDLILAIKREVSSSDNQDSDLEFAVNYDLTRTVTLLCDSSHEHYLITRLDKLISIAIKKRFLKTLDVLCAARERLKSKINTSIEAATVQDMNTPDDSGLTLLDDLLRSGVSAPTLQYLHENGARCSSIIRYAIYYTNHESITRLCEIVPKEIPQLSNSDKLDAITFLLSHDSLAGSDEEWPKASQKLAEVQLIAASTDFSNAEYNSLDRNPLYRLVTCRQKYARASSKTELGEVLLRQGLTNGVHEALNFALRQNLSEWIKIIAKQRVDYLLGSKKHNLELNQLIIFILDRTDTDLTDKMEKILSSNNFKFEYSSENNMDRFAMALVGCHSPELQDLVFKHISDNVTKLILSRKDKILYDAIVANNHYLVRCVLILSLKQKANTNQADLSDPHNTYLHLAALDRNEHLIGVYSAMGMNSHVITEPNRRQVTPLQIALSQGDYAHAEVMIRAGVKSSKDAKVEADEYVDGFIKYYSENGTRIPVHKALDTNDVNMLRWLLANWCDASELDNNNESILDKAITNKNYRAISIILAHGFDTITNEQRIKAIFALAKIDSADSLALLGKLLDNSTSFGDEANITDSEGCTALSLLTHLDKIGHAELLFRKTQSVARPCDVFQLAEAALPQPLKYHALMSTIVASIYTNTANERPPSSLVKAAITSAHSSVCIALAKSYPYILREQSLEFGESNATPIHYLINTIQANASHSGHTEWETIFEQLIPDMRQQFNDDELLTFASMLYGCDHLKFAIKLLEVCNEINLEKNKGTTLLHTLFTERVNDQSTTLLSQVCRTAVSLSVPDTNGHSVLSMLATSSANPTQVIAAYLPIIMEYHYKLSPADLDLALLIAMQYGDDQGNYLTSKYSYSAKCLNTALQLALNKGQGKYAKVANKIFTCLVTIIEDKLDTESATTLFNTLVEHHKYDLISILLDKVEINLASIQRAGLVLQQICTEPSLSRSTRLNLIRKFVAAEVAMTAPYQPYLNVTPIDALTVNYQDSDSEVAEIITEIPSNQFTPTAAGRLLLQLTRFRKIESAIALLKKVNADVGLHDEQGNTALHLAVASHHQSGTELSQMLVKLGADLFAKNQAGQSPLDHAYDKRLDLMPVTSLITHCQSSHLICYSDKACKYLTTQQSTNIGDMFMRAIDETDHNVIKWLCINKVNPQTNSTSGHVPIATILDLIINQNGYSRYKPLLDTFVSNTTTALTNKNLADIGHVYSRSRRTEYFFEVIQQSSAMHRVTVLSFAYHALTNLLKNLDNTLNDDVLIRDRTGRIERAFYIVKLIEKRTSFWQSLSSDVTATLKVTLLSLISNQQVYKHIKENSPHLFADIEAITNSRDGLISLLTPPVSKNIMTLFNKGFNKDSAEAKRAADIELSNAINQLQLQITHQLT